PPPPISAVSTLAPADGSECTPLDCTAAGCRCVCFVFPDTDGEVRAPGDGHTLAGGVAIGIDTDGVTTALTMTCSPPGCPSTTISSRPSSRCRPPMRSTACWEEVGTRLRRSHFPPPAK